MSSDPDPLTVNYDSTGSDIDADSSSITSQEVECDIFTVVSQSG